MSQRDDVKSSGPQEIKDSLCHSFPHFMHFTRNLFITYTTLGLGSFCSLKRPWSFFKPRAGCITELGKKHQAFSKSIKTVTTAFQAAGEKGNPQEERAGRRQCHEHFISPLSALCMPRCCMEHISTPCSDSPLGYCLVNSLIKRLNLVISQHNRVLWQPSVKHFPRRWTAFLTRGLGHVKHILWSHYNKAQYIVSWVLKRDLRERENAVTSFHGVASWYLWNFLCHCSFRRSDAGPGFNGHH